MAAASWIKSHPGKGIWTFAAILFNAIRFPLWLIYFLPSFTRQSSKWSLRKSVLNQRQPRFNNVDHTSISIAN
jgi:hypothetical protein